MGFAFSCRMALYEPLRESVAAVTGSSPPTTAFWAGLCTGAITNAAACPFFNVKALQQSQSSKIPTGSFFSELVAVTKKAGIAGHYRGVSALFARGGAISAGQLTGYDAAKRAVRSNGLTEGLHTHVGCSLFAAGCAAVLSLPPDIILNRYQGALALGVRYDSVMHCLTELVRTEGVIALFRGLGPQYMKLAPVFLLTLPLYEQLRRLAGLGYLRLRSTAVAATSQLTYPVRPPPGKQNGRVIDTAMWSKVQTIFPINVWDKPSAILHDEELEMSIHVENARELKEPPTLAAAGFELVNQPGAAFDFETEAGLNAYRKETEALVKRMTGAASATVFHSMTRRSDRDNKDSAKGAGGIESRHHASVTRVHSDFTPANGPQRVSDLEERGLVPKGTLKKRWSIVNVWRSMSPYPIEERPLAMLDARTVDQDSVWSYSLVHEPSAEVGDNNSIAYDPAHRWFYFPKMTLDEALLFYTFDGHTGETPRFVFHTAFDPPSAGLARPPPRESIEARCLIVFDD